jgi:hypothetical protein
MSCVLSRIELLIVNLAQVFISTATLARQGLPQDYQEVYLHRQRSRHLMRLGLSGMASLAAW